MNVIDISGIRYLKATDAAKKVGYTADYVGQLARGGKLDAKQIGRSWYVSEEDILAHKKANHRSTKQKSHEAFQKITTHTEHAIYNSVYSPEARATWMPEYRKRLLDTSVTYEKDLAPLVPQKIVGGHVELTLQASESFEAQRLGRELEIERTNDIQVLEIEKTPAPMHGVLDLEEEFSEEEQEEEEEETQVFVRHGSEIEERYQVEKEVEEAKEQLTSFEKKLILRDHERTAISTAVTPQSVARPFPREIAYIPAPLPGARRQMSIALRLTAALVPLAFVLALTGAFASVFMHKVVVYERGALIGSQPFYETSYHVTQMSAVIEAFRDAKAAF